MDKNQSAHSMRALIFLSFDLLEKYALLLSSVLHLLINIGFNYFPDVIEIADNNKAYCYDVEWDIYSE